MLFVSANAVLRVHRNDIVVLRARACGGLRRALHFEVKLYCIYTDVHNVVMSMPNKIGTPHKRTIVCIRGANKYKTGELNSFVGRQLNPGWVRRRRPPPPMLLNQITIYFYRVEVNNWIVLALIPTYICRTNSCNVNTKPFMYTHVLVFLFIYAVDVNSLYLSNVEHAPALYSYSYVWMLKELYMFSNESNRVYACSKMVFLKWFNVQVCLNHFFFVAF